MRKHATIGFGPAVLAAAMIAHRDVVRLGHERRYEDHEHRVDLGVGEHGAHQAPRRSRRSRAAMRSTGFVVRHVRRHEAAELGLGGVREHGHVEPGSFAHVGREDPGAAAVRDDRHAPSGGQRLVHEHLRRVEQLGEGVDADHAGLAEQHIGRDVGRRQRRGARRPAGKARRPRIPGVFEGGATQPAGMPRPRGGP